MDSNSELEFTPIEVSVFDDAVEQTLVPEIEELHFTTHDEDWQSAFTDHPSANVSVEHLNGRGTLENPRTTILFDKRVKTMRIENTKIHKYELIPCIAFLIATEVSLTKAARRDQIIEWMAMGTSVYTKPKVFSSEDDHDILSEWMMGIQPDYRIAAITDFATQLVDEFFQSKLGNSNMHKTREVVRQFVLEKGKYYDSYAKLAVDAGFIQFNACLITVDV